MIMDGTLDNMKTWNISDFMLLYFHHWALSCTLRTWIIYWSDFRPVKAIMVMDGTVDNMKTWNISDSMFLYFIIDFILNNSFLLPVKATMIMDGTLDNMKNWNISDFTFLLSSLISFSITWKWYQICQEMVQKINEWSSRMGQ